MPGRARPNRLLCKVSPVYGAFKARFQIHPANASRAAMAPQIGFAVVHSGNELYGSRARDRGLPGGSWPSGGATAGFSLGRKRRRRSEHAGAPGAAASRRSVTTIAV
jgi:hypothetical protein